MQMKSKTLYKSDKNTYYKSDKKLSFQRKSVVPMAQTNFVFLF